MQEQAVDFGRKWYVMAAVSMAIFLATIDGSIVNVALPTLVRELDTNFATVQWMVLAYLLTLSTLVLSMGRLGDMIGKKPVYVVGFVIFTIGSVLCGIAPGVYWLIAFRVVQAIGGAMVFSLGMAIITEAFPPEERGKALGITGTVASVGFVLGPTLGGILIGALSWRWIFLVNLPVGIIGTWMVIKFVPNFNPIGKQIFDFAGAVTLFVGMFALLLALTWGQQLGFSDPRILGLFVTSAVFMTLFIVIELRSAQPMVDLTLFKNNLFSISLITGFLTFVSIAGTTFLLPFYLENVLGYSTQRVGLLLAIVPIMLGISAPIAGSMSDKFGTRRISIIGLIFLLIGYYAISTLDAQTSSLGYILRLLPIGLGMGSFQSPNNSAIMGAVRRQRLGIASGLLSVTRTLGQTTGVALLGAFWAGRVIVYTGQILEGGATAASTAAQVSGLQETFMSVMFLLAIGLALSVWGLVQERRLKQQFAPVQAG